MTQTTLHHLFGSLRTVPNKQGDLPIVLCLANSPKQSSPCQQVSLLIHGCVYSVESLSGKTQWLGIYIPICLLLKCERIPFYYC